MRLPPQISGRKDAMPAVIKTLAGSLREYKKPALMTLLLMELGRGLMALAFGASVSAAAGFLTTDIISWLFTALILWIARRLDGIMEDQKQYLHRVAQEREEEKGGF